MLTLQIEPWTWEKVPGWFGPPAVGGKELYDEAVKRAADDAHFVEVGVFCGKSAAYMGSLIKESGKKIQFDAVDNYSQVTHANRITEDVTKLFFMVCGVESYVNLRSMHQLEAAQTYADGSLDFVYVDSNHAYDAMRACIAAFLPKIKVGGVIAGDDYYEPHFPGVVKAVDELLPNRKLTGTAFSFQVT